MALCVVLTDAKGERDRKWCACTIFYIYLFAKYQEPEVSEKD